MDYRQAIEHTISTADKHHYNFLGITRKEYPKWCGWKIIAEHKKEGKDIKDINNEHLTVLVRNWHYLNYLRV